MAGESEVVVDVKDAAEDKLLPDKNGQGPDEGEQGEEEEVKTPGGCGNPLTIIPVLVLAIGAIVCLIGIVPLGSLQLIAALVGLGGSFLAVLMICRYGGMRHQLNRFKRENARLAKTSQALEGEVTKLEDTNKQLAVQVDKLEGTVDELQQVSDNLQDNLDQFADIRQNIEDFAKESGADIKNVIGDINGVYDKIFDLTVKNERALLQRIAQDLEFMDRDAAMSKQEFQRFIMRIPKHLQDRFAAMNTSFEEIAGEDNVIDHKEIQVLIDRLMEENQSKKQ